MAVSISDLLSRVFARQTTRTPDKSTSALYPSASKRDPTKYVLHDLVSQFPWDDLPELTLEKRSAILHYAMWWAVEAVRDTVEREEHLIQTILDNLQDDPEGMKWRVWVENLLTETATMRSSCEDALPEFGAETDRRVELAMLDRKPR